MAALYGSAAESRNLGNGWCDRFSPQKQALTQPRSAL
jgi:hypothetical protein